ncbi:fungal-specific transcription factor domain-containing protein [Mycena floridula]|nr:fungal-specific transcription factor domain-containing protein [Mycena floridula]
MPPAPKSSTSPRRPGAPKAKGAVRAKSGCYTCRIRRKKCDEKPDHNNACETCVRLRLECLGFGAKRPDWLRENSKVLTIREKIKTFLASQGMIKGHSGNGPRGEEDEPVILRLAIGSDAEYSSSSDSPQSQLLTLSSADDFRPSHNTSSARDEPLRDDWYNAPSPPQLRPDSPYGSSTGYDSLPYSYQPPNQHNSSSTSLVPSWNNSGALGTLAPPSPTNLSTFSPLYHAQFLDEDDFFMMDTGGFPPYLVPDTLLDHYMDTVVGLQYLLADRHRINALIYNNVQSGFGREGAKLLASVHRRRLHDPYCSALMSEDGLRRYDGLRELLNQKEYNDNDATASLQVVSSFLFDGGEGEWEQWLDIACAYSNTVLGRFPGGVVDALCSCTAQERFLIQTTIWFDVLASVTTLKPPRFLNVIREFCAPEISGFHDLIAQEKLSMMSIMGCKNIVVWALAEISTLSAWKRHQLARGCLSMPELVQKGGEIDIHLAPSTSQHPELIQPTVDASWSKYTSEIFRASARLYLRSVVSGDHPSVPEIAEAVTDTIKCLQTIPKDDSSGPSAVIRSTVFGLFIAGCLTDNPENRGIVEDHLGSGSGPGNCITVKKKLQDMWNSRGAKREAVPWRESLHKSKLLLV